MNSEIEHETIFGWMRRNPTWSKEIAAIDALRAEVEHLRHWLGLIAEPGDTTSVEELQSIARTALKPMGRRQHEQSTAGGTLL